MVSKHRKLQQTYLIPTIPTMVETSTTDSQNAIIQVAGCNSQVNSLITFNVTFKILLKLTGNKICPT